MGRKLLIGTATILVIGAVSALWGYNYWLEERVSPPSQAALAALVSDEIVAIEEDEWLVMRPANSSPRTALVFYPGGECDHRGYAPALRQIAEQGYLVVVVPMPFYLAVLAPDRAKDVMAAFPGIEKWVIGGHSLGGAMAGHFVKTHPSTMDGLLIWDSYIAEADDLSGREIPTMQIHRSSEVEPIPPDYAERAHLMPPQTRIEPIAGANHINFGSFASAPRWESWSAASLPIEEQQRQVAELSVSFLADVSETQ